MPSLPLTPMSGERARIAQLSGFAASLLVHAGLRSDDARAMADCLVFAQSSGIDSHGLMHLPAYLNGLRRSALNPRPRFVFTAERAAAASLDAEQAPGILAALAASDRASALAKQAGVGAVAVRNSGHFGVASYFVHRMLGQQQVGLVFSNASPSVAPRGGRQPLFGTNPIAAGFPRADGQPLVIDLASTLGSRARIRKAAAAGEEIPADWALDAEGQPTTSAEAALQGSMQALGGAKGTLLCLLVELLCVSLSGGALGAEVRPPQDPSSQPADVSHLFLAFDPEAFGGAAALSDRVAEIAAAIESVEPVEADSPVRLPGARAAAARREAERNGILVTPALANALAKARSEAAAFTHFTIGA